MGTLTYHWHGWYRRVCSDGRVAPCPAVELGGAHFVEEKAIDGFAENYFLKFRKD